jgi:hypothetical protein
MFGSAFVLPSSGISLEPDAAGPQAVHDRATTQSFTNLSLILSVLRNSEPEVQHGKHFKSFDLLTILRSPDGRMSLLAWGGFNDWWSRERSSDVSGPGGCNRCRMDLGRVPAEGHLNAADSEAARTT